VSFSMITMITLTLHFAASQYTPATSLLYRANRSDPLITDSRVTVGDRELATTVTADFLELALRYSQKGVTSAELAFEPAVYRDTNGDGLIEMMQAKPSDARMPVWTRAAEFFGLSERDMLKYSRAKMVYDIAQDLNCEDARLRMFTASCGSTVADVHATPTQSAIWAAVPPRGQPNEVHRHLGGSVYCLFFRGEGRFHRLDPTRGFETVPIKVTDENSFQFIAIPTHLWYQPINTGSDALQYFMIHEPAFERSEQLVLDEAECPASWKFEY